MAIGIPGIGLNRNSLSVAIRSLFSSGQQGGWYDPSDLSTMWQDAAGTTPAAVDQPVGFIGDKRLGFVRGAELVVNGDGGSGATGWSAVNGSFAAAAGEFTLTNAGAAEAIANNTGLVGAAVAGKFYEITFTLVSTLNGSGVVTVGGVRTPITGGNGSKRYILQAGASGPIGLGTNSATSGAFIVFKNVSARELPGSHLTQATTASRPTLKNDTGYYGQQFDGLDDYLSCATGGGGTAGFFLCAAVRVDGGAGAIRAVWDDAGTNTGYRVRVNASNQLELAAGNGATTTSIATVPTVIVGETHVLTAWDDGTNLKVQVDNGAVSAVARPAVSAGSAGYTVGKHNTTSAQFFNGRIFDAVYLKDSAPDLATIARVQRQIAASAGVTL